ncbi:MAG: hypothetical protein ACRDSL_19905 [Pseudonocardiaceae bacterium]
MVRIRAARFLLLILWWTFVVVAAGAALAFGVLVWYFAFDDWRTWWHAYANQWPTMTGDLFVQAILTTCTAMIFSVVLLYATIRDLHLWRERG